jgi:hypothetical protein
MMSFVSCIPKPSVLMSWFRPTDWKHVEDELCTQLGDNFLIHASAANPYLQTQLGIDLGGKRLADEVKKPLHVT